MPKERLVNALERFVGIRGYFYQTRLVIGYKERLNFLTNDLSQEQPHPRLRASDHLCYGPRPEVCCQVLVHWSHVSCVCWVWRGEHPEPEEVQQRMPLPFKRHPSLLHSSKGVNCRQQRPQGSFMTGSSLRILPNVLLLLNFCDPKNFLYPMSQQIPKIHASFFAQYEINSHILDRLFTLAFFYMC